MNKSLKFKPQFIEAVASKSEITTTRLYDDKDLTVGDEVDFLNSKTGEKFASGKIINIQETIFEEMVKESADRQGMYEQYKDYYHKEIEPKDSVKYITFQILR